MKLEDLVYRAAEYDETLARDIKDYVHGRKYGLVYEASKPEYVRVWNKTVVRGDIVNILPPRGTVENNKSENDPADVIYTVLSIKNNKAKLRDEEGEIMEAPVADIVALARFDKPVYAGLKEIDRVERNALKPYHVVINGENYHALQLLAYAYQGMVDCIYIDPPYNSGASDWKYNNNYVGKEDIYRHSKWLTFMEDRLKVAKKLLNPKDSVLIVTIDEKEYLRLGLLLEQLFPEARIQMISTIINPTGTKRADEFSRTNEFIYFVRIGQSTIEQVADVKTVTSNAEVHWEPLRRHTASNIRDEQHPNQFFPLFINVNTNSIDEIGENLPFGIDVSTVKPRKNCETVWPIRDDGREMMWGLKRETFIKRLNSGYVRIGRHTPDKPQKYSVSYLASGTIADIESGKAEINGYDEHGAVKAYYKEGKKAIPTTQWAHSSHDAKVNGTLLLQQILLDRKFPFPKSLYAVKDCLNLFIANKPDALVVDFFAGSGTTLHALNLINSLDGGHRRCICVTNNEVSEEETIVFSEKGLRQSDEEWNEHGIAKYVTWPRIKNSINGVDVSGKPLGGDYGCECETYEEYEGEVIDPNSGKKVRRKLFKKVKTPFYPELKEHKLSDGFDENAIFFDIEYLEPAVVSADLAYDSISPILWLCGGCKGERLSRQKGYSIGETYGVLFEPRNTKQFIKDVKENDSIRTIFIVTDVAERYRNLCMEFPERRVMQLYESYLRSFEINAIG